MIVTLGVVIVTVLIVLNAAALADIIQNDTLPPPVARAWLLRVTIAPGLGAVLWFLQRAQLRPPPDPVGMRPLPDEQVSPEELTRLFEEIDRFRSPKT